MSEKLDKDQASAKAMRGWVLGPDGKKHRVPGTSPAALARARRRASAETHPTPTIVQVEPEPVAATTTPPPSPYPAPRAERLGAPPPRLAPPVRAGVDPGRLEGPRRQGAPGPPDPP